MSLTFSRAQEAQALKIPDASRAFWLDCREYSIAQMRKCTDGGESFFCSARPSSSSRGKERSVCGVSSFLDPSLFSIIDRHLAAINATNTTAQQRGAHLLCQRRRAIYIRISLSSSAFAKCQTLTFYGLSRRVCSTVNYLFASANFF